MPAITNTKRARVNCLALFCFISLTYFSQKKNLPVITRLVHGECNESCFKEELQEVHWKMDAVQLVFSALNQCDVRYSASILKAVADTLEVEVGYYTKGFQGSKQSLPDLTLAKFCMCYYRYELNASELSRRPCVIIINGKSYYLMGALRQMDDVFFHDFYKNQSSEVTYRNLNKLLGKNYHSSEVRQVVNELGNDSVPDLQEKDFRTIHFEEDGFYITFSDKNLVQSMRIEKKFAGKIIDHLTCADRRDAWLKTLGRPDREKEYTNSAPGENGNTKQVPAGYRYYFKKYNLLIDFDGRDQVTGIYFSLQPSGNDF